MTKRVGRGLFADPAFPQRLLHCAAEARRVDVMPPAVDVEVIWPGGERQRFPGLAARQLHVLEQTPAIAGARGPISTDQSSTSPIA